jgi:hypothetical protein
VVVAGLVEVLLVVLVLVVLVFVVLLVDGLVVVVRCVEVIGPA